VISSMVSRTSAVVLFVGGVGLLFAPAEVLREVAPGLPPTADWLAQLLAAAWLAAAALNWIQRFTLLGGIYGRPIVSANLVLYFISAIVLLKASLGPDGSRGLWFVTVPMVLLALAYGALLVRGPFDPLQS
jgi:hypothetical protein